jgi:hypothetical protein
LAATRGHDFRGSTLFQVSCFPLGSRDQVIVTSSLDKAIVRIAKNFTDERGSICSWSNGPRPGVFTGNSMCTFVLGDVPPLVSK